MRASAADESEWRAWELDVLRFLAVLRRVGILSATQEARLMDVLARSDPGDVDDEFDAAVGDQALRDHPVADLLEWVRAQARVVVLLRAVARGGDGPWGRWHRPLTEARDYLRLYSRAMKDVFGPLPDTNGGAR